jgi:hypothetical protein
MAPAAVVPEDRTIIFDLDAFPNSDRLAALFLSFGLTEPGEDTVPGEPVGAGPTAEPRRDGAERDETELDGPELDGPELDGPQLDAPELDAPLARSSNSRRTEQEVIMPSTRPDAEQPTAAITGAIEVKEELHGRSLSFSHPLVTSSDSVTLGYTSVLFNCVSTAHLPRISFFHKGWVKSSRYSTGSFVRPLIFRQVLPFDPRLNPSHSLAPPDSHADLAKKGWKNIARWMVGDSSALDNYDPLSAQCLAIHALFEGDIAAFRWFRSRYHSLINSAEYSERSMPAQALCR